jgi:phosphoserine phosphatase RsbU/P
VTSNECFFFLEGQRWPCAAGAVLGRAGTVAVEALRPVEVLSRRQLRIEHREEVWYVVALPEARNDTFLEGRRMVRGVPYPLSRMQTLRVDTFQFHLGIADGLATQMWTEPPVRHQVENEPIPALVVDEPSAASTAASGLEALPGAVIETDVRLNILAANAPAFVLLGNQALGRDLDEWTPERTKLRERLLRLNEGEFSGPLEFAFEIGNAPHTLELEASRLTGSLLIFLRDVTAEKHRVAQAQAISQRLINQSEALAELSLSKSFHEGDVATSLTLLTHRAAEALECRRVSAWLKSEATTDRKVVCQACHDTAARAQTGAVTDLAYCPAFFDKLATAEPWASADAASPMMSVLIEIGFARADTGTLLCVGLQHAGEFYGLLSFERVDAARGWSREDRQFALCLASYGVLALQTRERHEVLAELRRSQGHMTAELEEANRYIQRILPEPILEGPITAEWHMQPSEALGGDSFGYHWVGDLFVMYILDVVGHGTGMALLSISVLNNVRARLLIGEAAMQDPAGVLRDLNAAFPMENQNNMLFSMWYGVFDRRTRLLTYSSAGHPPAILLHGEVTGDAEDYATLGTDGPSVGAMDGTEFVNGQIAVDRGAKLFIFTDGAFEIPLGPSREWTFEEFVAVVRSTHYMPGGETAYLRKRVGALCSQSRLPDDFTVVRLSFES